MSCGDPVVYGSKDHVDEMKQYYSTTETAKPKSITDIGQQLDKHELIFKAIKRLEYSAYSLDILINKLVGNTEKPKDEESEEQLSLAVILEITPQKLDEIGDNLRRKCREIEGILF